jgi:thioredoxin 1
MKHIMKRLFSIATVLKLLLITSITAASTGNPNKEGDKSVTVISLSNDTFKQTVFIYEKNKEWKYEGTVLPINDFYAGWCVPCRESSPIVEDIAK